MKKLKISLPFPPSLNTAYPTIIKGGKPIRVKSASVKKWIKDAPDFEDIFFENRVTISYLMFFPDDRDRDGQNYMKVPLDYMVNQGFFVDDNRKYVAGEQWIDGGIDKKNPRIEVTIKEIKK